MFASFPDRFFLWSTGGCQQIPGLHSSLCQSGREEYLWCLSQRKEACLPLKTQELSLSGFHTISEPIYSQGIGILWFLWACPLFGVGSIIPQYQSWAWGRVVPSREVRKWQMEAEKQPIEVHHLLPFFPFLFSPSFLLSFMVNSVPGQGLNTWEHISCPWGPSRQGKEW